MKNQQLKRASKRKKQQRTTSLAIIGVGGLLLVLVAAWIIGTNKPAPKVQVKVNGAPAIQVDKESVDLGEVKLGKVVDVSFTLSNVGDKPLSLTEAPYVEVVEGC